MKNSDGENPEKLKLGVRRHWEIETCGVRYGNGDDRLVWFRSISDRRYELEPYIRDFARFPDAAGKRVLEIGVGAGADFYNWCMHATHATGVDLTDGAIGLVQERLVLEGVSPDRYALQTADAEALPFADATFDLVYSWGVLHHTPDTERAYSEVFRVLKPGGTMRTMIYHVPSWTGIMLYFVYGLAKGAPFLGLRRAIYEYLESPGTKAYTLNEAALLARRAGFERNTASTRLGSGDLLLIQPSGRYQSPIYKLAWSLWPRPLVRLLGDRFGLYLLLEGRKPA